MNVLEISECRNFIKSMILIFEIVDKMLEWKSYSKAAYETDVTGFLQLSLDSVALLGHLIDETNLKRLELIYAQATL